LITHDKVGYTGYVASDDILANHDTEYTAITSSSTTMAQFRVLQDLDSHSALRFKCTLKDTGGAGCHTSCRVYLDGVKIADMQEDGGNYVGHSDDGTLSSVKRGSIIRFQLHQYLNGTGYGKLCKICGKVGPVVLI